ncbi:MAG: DNA recombination protein RmuC, partial [Mesorhizobium sp.]
MNDLTTILSEPIARLGATTITLGHALAFGAVLFGRLGQTMTGQTKSTHESLAKLQERLAVIDTAQGNIQSLASQVVQLQAILSNKQTRGAFGQSRMEAIVADGLPHGAYEFQATLSNGSRPDCLVKMPNGAPA